MAKANTTISSKLTYEDKAHKRFMDKLNVFKDGLIHITDNFRLINEQTLDSVTEYEETVSKAQELERSKLYEIINTSDDETKREEAYARLKELDHDKNEKVKNYKEFSQTEGDKTRKCNKELFVFLVVVCGSRKFIIKNGKALTRIGATIGKKLLSN